MDQDTPIVHRGIFQKPQVNQDTPIVHLGPLAQTKMQALVAFAEVFLLSVPTSLLVEAPHRQAACAANFCISDGVPLLGLTCEATLANKQRQEGIPLLDGAWLELNYLFVTR